MKRHTSDRAGTETRATLTVPEAGTVLGLGREAAYAAARRGDIPVLRFGRRVVVPRVALERLLEQGTKAA